jgi:hypothetical protein
MSMTHGNVAYHYLRTQELTSMMPMRINLQKGKLLYRPMG